jgi:hypothetical protein
MWVAALVMAFWCYKSPGFWYFLQNESMIPGWAILLAFIGIMYGSNFLADR